MPSRSLLFGFILACTCRPSPAKPTPPASASTLAPDLAAPADDVPPGLRARGMGRAAADDAAVTGVDRPDVSMRTMVKVGDSWYTAQPGSELRSHEHIAIEVTLTRPGCVHLLFANPKGKSDQLFPIEGEDPCLQPGRFRIPPARSPLPDIELDDTTGLEVLHLVVTDEPLAAVDPALARLVEDAKTGKNPDIALRERASARPTRPAGISHKPTAGYEIPAVALRERGGYRTRAQGASTDGRLAADGVLVISVPFYHID